MSLGLTGDMLFEPGIKVQWTVKPGEIGRERFSFAQKSNCIWSEGLTEEDGKGECFFRDAFRDSETWVQFSEGRTNSNTRRKPHPGHKTLGGRCSWPWISRCLTRVSHPFLPNDWEVAAAVRVAMTKRTLGLEVLLKSDGDVLEKERSKNVLELTWPEIVCTRLEFRPST